MSSKLGEYKPFLTFNKGLDRQKTPPKQNIRVLSINVERSRLPTAQHEERWEQQLPEGGVAWLGQNFL